MTAVRRNVLRGLAVGGAALLLAAHTPYRQWVVYRRRHLLIGCHKRDPETWRIARQVVALLEEHLPDASARVARGPDARRLASLLLTGQLEVAVLDPAEAAEMAAGTGPFAAWGPVPLALLLPVAGRALFAVASFPERHAWLVTRALLGTDLVPAVEPEGEPAPLAWHPGALAAVRGLPEPADASG